MSLRGQQQNRHVPPGNEIKQEEYPIPAQAQQNGNLRNALQRDWDIATLIKNTMEANFNHLYAQELEDRRRIREKRKRERQMLKEQELKNAEQKKALVAQSAEPVKIGSRGPPKSANQPKTSKREHQFHETNTSAGAKKPKKGAVHFDATMDQLHMY